MVAEAKNILPKNKMQYTLGKNIAAAWSVGTITPEKLPAISMYK